MTKAGIRPYRADYRKSSYSEIGTINLPGGKSATISCAHAPKILVDGGRIALRRLDPKTGKRADNDKSVKALKVVEPRGDSKASCLTLEDKDSIAIFEATDFSLLYRKFYEVECERLQTLPDGYTEGVAKSQRYKMLGNGWNVETVAHCFRPLKKIFGFDLIGEKSK